MKYFYPFLLAVWFSHVCQAANIVCLTVEDPNNYDAPNFLTRLAENHLRPSGHRVTIVQGEKPLPTHFDGLLPALQEADLLIVFVRRATPPQEQLDAIRTHLAAGRPLLGIRTANHAFVPMNNATLAPNCATWPEFTPDVLGGQNTGYETKGMPYSIMKHPAAPENSPLLEGVDVASIIGHQSLYRVLPLAEDVTPLLVGTAQGIEPSQPVAWTRLVGPAKARIFYTSLGAPDDAKLPAVQRLILNAVRWTLE